MHLTIVPKVTHLVTGRVLEPTGLIPKLMPSHYIVLSPQPHSFQVIFSRLLLKTWFSVTCLEEDRIQNLQSPDMFLGRR